MAGTITFDGLATGIKTSETIDKLMVVESRPKILKQAEQTRVQNQLSAWQDVNTKLLAVSVAAGDLARLGTWSAQQVSSSNESLLTARANLDAAPGTYTVSVERLAKTHQIATPPYLTASASVGTGALNIKVGDGATHTINLDASNNTLEGAAKAINAAKIGVTASVVGSEGNYKLLLASNSTGVSNALTITQDAGVNLAFDTANPVQAAQDAQVKLGSGAGAIVVDSASNSVDSVIKGVTLDLKAAEQGKEVTVSVSRNSSAIAEKVKTFVDAYNDAASYIAKQFAYDSDKDVAGILMGDSTLMTVQRNLSGMVTGIVGSGSEYKALSSVGIKVGDGGALAFDQSKLAAAMEKDFTGVMRLFRQGGDSTHAKVSFVYASGKTRESSSGYAVDVTQVATRASATGTAAAGLAIDGTNDSLTLSIDGGRSVTVTLAHDANYTASELAEELQAKINEAGANVKVTAESNGALTITSERYGAASRVSVSGGNALDTLKFSGVAVAQGKDVAGTINGEPATGTGQLLKGNAGNATTDGLQVMVELDGGLGSGSEASVTVTKGIFSRFDEYLSSLTDPISGAVGLRQTSLSASISSIDRQIKDMDARLDAKRESLLEQFNRMEKAVGALNSQGNYLANALGGLGNNWKWNS